MFTKVNGAKCRIMFLVILMLFLISGCNCGKMDRSRTKFKRKVNSASDLRQYSAASVQVLGTVQRDDTKVGADSSLNTTKSRGFSSIFSLPKVLNFFPVGGERECQPEGYQAAKAGICLNPYDCHQRAGRASGDCAHGFGVCCVFEVSCGGMVQNNISYFLSPKFPELWGGEHDCNITIEKSHAGITQLKIDFIHFSIGQPNRTSGECDEDAMILGDGESKFVLCGQNHGQHVYYTLSSKSEARDSEDLPGDKNVVLMMRMRATEMPRIWLMRFTQMPLANSAPHNCLQYYTENNGTIRTFNYAVNGRHLAEQEYKACIRRNTGMCSVRYTPCDERSFRIEPGEDQDTNTVQQEEMMPVNQTQAQEDELEGSGEDPNAVDKTQSLSSSTSAPDNESSIWEYMLPFWMWQRRGKSIWSRWSPYVQHYNRVPDIKFLYHGYGNFGNGPFRYGRLRCRDRITISCENEYFVSSSSQGPGVCDPHHCGSSFCPGVESQHCYVESSTTPYAVSVHFGPPTTRSNPEENIGACLRYAQIPCDN